MKRTFITLAATLLVALVLLAGARAAGVFTVDWSTADGGGDRSSGGTYTIDGTIGQADAGMLSGDRFTVAGGYWAVVLPRARILLPLIRR
jgi:hypothetical protein